MLFAAWSLQVLAHRFGLIPLKVDPRLFKMPPPSMFEPNYDSHIITLYSGRRCSIGR